MPQCSSMTRKDSEKDSERPHYYSQFWLDVAAGRRVIGAPKPDEEGEGGDFDTPEPAPQRRATGRSTAQEVANDDYAHDGRVSNVVHPAVEPLATPEDFISPDTEEMDLDTSSSYKPGFQNSSAEEEEEETEDDFSASNEEYEDFEDEEEEEEEDEDDIGWGGGRSRKKTPRSTRPIKPANKKTNRREPRRGF